MDDSNDINNNNNNYNNSSNTGDINDSGLESVPSPNSSNNQSTEQRIQKRKEEAKRIMEERKKRELQQPQQSSYEEGIDGGGLDDGRYQSQQSYESTQPVGQKIGQRIERKAPTIPINKGQVASPSSASTVANSANIREDMVKKAYSFLSNPSVKNTPLARKVAYLEKKGLTSDEIKEALKRIETGNINGSGASSSGNAMIPSSRNVAPQKKPTQQSYDDINSNHVIFSQQQQQYFQQQHQMLQQQHQMAVNQIQSYQKRLEADDQRIAQMLSINNRKSWDGLLFSITAVVGAASGIAYLTSNYILPYLYGNKKKEENVDKKITELQQEIIKLQNNIFSQGNDFKEQTTSLKTLIDQQQQQIQQQQVKLNSTTVNTTQPSSSLSNSTEILEIKKELKNLTNLINSNSSKNNSIFDDDYKYSKPAATPPSTSLPGSNVSSGSKSYPPVVKTNPYSHLSWKPPTDQPPTIPSWQRPSSPSSTTTTTTTTTPSSQKPSAEKSSNETIPSWQRPYSPNPNPENSSNPPTPTKQQSSFSYGDVNSFSGTNSETFNSKPTTTTTTTTTSPKSNEPNESSETKSNDSGNSANDETPYSSDFLDVISQLKQGKTPPGIRTDIDDKPLENSTVNKSNKQRPKKPWEKDSLTSVTSNLSEEETKLILEDSPSIEIISDDVEEKEAAKVSNNDNN
ncbi:hypothetical protein DICPUDRAFT_81354 [Dictyostelium purpureum]|uniref:Peroxisomal membrane protein PEX14 n=1 Tax=Dictyostelium purpureum TaxID=5786 RepID=F0ZT84_DICPU|nr:uncharacterized protein DICPUDRAFT_81354 [Dictyostelium purpureum]EGC32847.1 hypothetical protein DICPUDRAFT_81354 [Dictyostelium purpureum]|eukprot:XP_003290632.1 hypothetical protein DICPUDRAFT_81354 [Dictyostelium purpureum]